MEYYLQLMNIVIKSKEKNKKELVIFYFNNDEFIIGANYEQN